MILFLVQDRKDELHLVDFTTSTGSKFALCGKWYRKNDIVNFFAIDDSVHNVCQKCCDDYELIYGKALRENPRVNKSALQGKVLNRYFENKKLDSLEKEFTNLTKRCSPKIGRYKMRILYRNVKKK
jgi:hypothetical protein